MHERLSPAPRQLAAIAALGACLIAGPAAAACPATPERTAYLRLVPDNRTLADLSLAVDAGQVGKLRLAGASALDGPCADDVEAYKMGLVGFRDGAVFATGVGGGFAPRPGLSLLPQAAAGPIAAERDALPSARFVMATEVDVGASAAGRRALHVGLWRMGDASVVAAYVRDGNRISPPVELLRSAHPIRSVTYFPAPDTNAGTLGLVQRGPDGIELIGIAWDHNALSRALRAGQ